MTSTFISDREWACMTGRQVLGVLSDSGGLSPTGWRDHWERLHSWGASQRLLAAAVFRFVATFEYGGSPNPYPYSRAFRVMGVPFCPQLTEVVEVLEAVPPDVPFDWTSYYNHRWMSRVCDACGDPVRRAVPACRSVEALAKLTDDVAVELLDVTRSPGRADDGRTVADRNRFLRELGVVVHEATGYILREPFRREWQTSDAVLVARDAWDRKDWGVLPILADALQDAGCERDDVLKHLRGKDTHSRSCWALADVLVPAAEPESE